MIEVKELGIHAGLSIGGTTSDRRIVVGPNNNSPRSRHVKKMYYTAEHGVACHVSDNTIQVCAPENIRYWVPANDKDAAKLFGIELDPPAPPVQPPAPPESKPLPQQVKVEQVAKPEEVQLEAEYCNCGKKHHWRKKVCGECSKPIALGGVPPGKRKESAA